ncbi:hypothetical protein D3C87_1091890 [compost metagenome]
MEHPHGYQPRGGTGGVSLDSIHLTTGRIALANDNLAVFGDCLLEVLTGEFHYLAVNEVAFKDYLNCAFTHCNHKPLVDLLQR